MGDVMHSMVIATCANYVRGSEYDPGVKAFKESLPEDMQSQVIGPLEHPLNGYVTYIFLSSGTRVDWGEEGHDQMYGERFADLFSFRHKDGSTPFEVVRIAYGERYDTRSVSIEDKMHGLHAYDVRETL